MRLSIKGKITQIDGEWLAEINHLDIKMKAPTPFKSIQAVADFIAAQLEGTQSKYSIQIEDGVFYLTTNKPKPLIKYVALCLSKNRKSYDDENLEEWFKVT